MPGMEVLRRPPRLILMKIRNRDLNIFSMSALDLFASALGAFIVLAVIALPFFPNTHTIDDDELLERMGETEAELEEAREALAAETAEHDETREALAQCEAESAETAGALEETEQALAQCQQAAEANFLLVLISWGTNDDVDLHVTDPSSREFYYSSRRHPGTDARFEEDNTRGPGNEVWVHPDVTPGEYRIEYKMFSKRASRPATVRGAALHRNGRSEFPELALSRDEERRTAVTIIVEADGDVSLR